MFLYTKTIVYISLSTPGRCFAGKKLGSRQQRTQCILPPTPVLPAKAPSRATTRYLVERLAGHATLHSLRVTLEVDPNFTNFSMKLAFQLLPILRRASFDHTSAADDTT